MMRPWIALLMLVAGAVSVGPALAQGTFPAPLPGSNPSVTLGDKPVMLSPPVAGVPAWFEPGAPTQGSGAPSSACWSDFAPLREDAEKKGKLIKAAGERHAPPDEACKLVGNYSQAELKMLKYVETNATRCRIPAGIAEQIKTDHKTTEALLTRVCGVAQQMRGRPPRGAVGDFDEIGHQPKGPVGDFDTIR
jgi:hypothetical protein